MAIITKGGTPEKGTPTVITLNKADLLSHPTVSADSYFSQESNWSKVKVFYNSTEGSQLAILNFDATEVTPTANFYVFALARDNFEVSYIEIIDFQNGKLTIPRADLTVADFDVEFISILAPSAFSYSPASTTAEEGPTFDTLTFGITVNINDGGEAPVYTLQDVAVNSIDRPDLEGTVTVNSSTGHISTVDTVSIGSFNQAVFTVRATNSAGFIETTFTLDVAAPPPPP